MCEQAELERFNKLYASRQPSVPEPEFLVVAAQQAEKLYARAFNRLAQQVSAANAERGRLMSDVWEGYRHISQGALTRLRDEAVAFMARAEAAERKLADSEAALHKSNDKLQQELDRYALIWCRFLNNHCCLERHFIKFGTVKQPISCSISGVLSQLLPLHEAIKLILDNLQGCVPCIVHSTLAILKRHV